MTGAIGGYGLQLFLPVILQDSIGFSEELAFILSAPPILFSVIVGAAFSWIADKTHLRGPYIVIESIIGLVGFSMVGFLKNSAARYVGKLLLIISGRLENPRS